jgi:hypothetical protein
MASDYNSGKRKIIIVINTMIKNRDKIKEVVEYSGKYYFIYNKYLWSIDYFPAEDNYILSYYPELNMDDLKIIGTANHHQLKRIDYSFTQYKTMEAYETFQELYQIVKEGFYNIDEVIEDILKDM